MGISLGLVGLGSFGSSFAPLFKAHPGVDRIAFCDREPERIRKFADDPFYADKFDERDTYESLEAICASDVDALVIITQHWLHAAQCLQAMEAGKHVYSAVPLITIPCADEILEYCDRLVRTCERTGMTYMYGETTCYHPEAMFCRRMAAEGRFGDFVYCEGSYLHDVDANCSLREVIKRRLDSAAGREWEKIREDYLARGVQNGPMHYPTHSTAGPVYVMDTYAEEVTAHGWANRTDDPYFKYDAFSNEVALFRMHNGASVRIMEARELCAGGEYFRVYGTSGAYEDDRWNENGRTCPTDGKAMTVTELTDEEMRDPLPEEVQKAFKLAMHQDKTPEELDVIDFTPRGHRGSHPYLVHEFVSALTKERRPEISVWDAVRFTAMGATAHKSALAGGLTLKVPDWGKPSS